MPAAKGEEAEMDFYLGHFRMVIAFCLGPESDARLEIYLIRRDGNDLLAEHVEALYAMQTQEVRRFKGLDTHPAEAAKTVIKHMMKEKFKAFWNEGWNKDPLSPCEV